MEKKVNGSSKPPADVPSVHAWKYRQNKYKRGILIDNSTKYAVF
jgi:hypothetical protein